MKNAVLSLTVLIMIVFIFFSSCTKDNDSSVPPTPTIKVGLVSSVGGFNDRGFNQLALTGLNRAAGDMSNIIAESRESLDTAAIRSNIAYFVQEKCNLIITLGYDSDLPTLQAARENPSIKFALIDFAEPNSPSNMISFKYRVDQSAFLCGFIGAYWANLMDSQSPVASWVGGPDIEEIEHFETGYLSGISYFNTMYHKAVQSTGNFTTSFTDTLQGARVADSLITLGADVIFPFAGKTGNGALYETKSKGKWAIGVDIDQYVSIPDVGSILLTSCLKKLDNTVYNAIQYSTSSAWGTTKVYYGSLSSVDVDIAPFHDYDAQIPDSIKTAIGTIRTGIINGTIPTGWTP
jgi:basic membrane protein A and related proteins